MITTNRLQPPRMLTPNARLYLRLVRVDVGLWLFLRLAVREVFRR